MGELSQRPGLMIYFDVRPVFKRLSYEEKGVLLDAILDYGQYGVIPEFDGALGVAWDLMQSKIDRDAERYEKTVAGSKYAAAVRHARETDDPVEYMRQHGFSECDILRMDANLCERTKRIETVPTTTATPTATPTANTSGAITCYEGVQGEQNNASPPCSPAKKNRPRAYDDEK